ncbi:HNH endonuclease [Acinetobacter sp.]|uniref:HNH endonuclease n=1 Tax=Acinetobacter sp. TaxID=472 RepID=UPI003BAFB83A
MKKINLPNFTINETYQLSLQYIDQSKPHRKIIFDNLTALTDEIFSYSDEYEEKAYQGKLHELDKDKFEDHSEDLVKLYTSYFSNNKPQYSTIRKFYDLILTNGNEDKNKIIKCPYCLSTICSHVDHFLPESVYSGLAVNPKNLIPSCHNCNTKKKAKIFKIIGQHQVSFFHPYYDDLGDILWLKANVTLEQNLLSVSFFVDSSLDVAKEIIHKINYTFDELGMASYLSNKAAETELTTLMAKFRSKDFWLELSNEEITTTLDSDRKLFILTHGKNHWLTALYDELSKRSDLYDVLKIS